MTDQDQGRTITTGTEDGDDDAYNPENMSNADILEMLNDEDWVDTYGDDVPLYLWKVYEDMWRDVPDDSAEGS